MNHGANQQRVYDRLFAQSTTAMLANAQTYEPLSPKDATKKYKYIISIVLCILVSWCVIAAALCGVVCGVLVLVYFWPDMTPKCGAPIPLNYTQSLNYQFDVSQVSELFISNPAASVIISQNASVSQILVSIQVHSNEYYYNHANVQCAVTSSKLQILLDDKQYCMSAVIRISLPKGLQLTRLNIDQPNSHTQRYAQWIQVVSPPNLGKLRIQELQVNSQYSTRVELSGMDIDSLRVQDASAVVISDLVFNHAKIFTSSDVVVYNASGVQPWSSTCTIETSFGNTKLQNVSNAIFSIPNSSFAKHHSITIRVPSGIDTEIIVTKAKQSIVTFDGGHNGSIINDTSTLFRAVMNVMHEDVPIRTFIQVLTPLQVAIETA